MSIYLSRFNYTPEAWARLVESAGDGEVARLVGSAGGRLREFWYAVEQQDVVVVWQAADELSAAAVALAAGPGGSFRAVETTLLLSSARMDEVLRRRTGTSRFPDGPHDVDLGDVV